MPQEMEQTIWRRIASEIEDTLHSSGVWVAPSIEFARQVTDAVAAMPEKDREIDGELCKVIRKTLPAYVHDPIPKRVEDIIREILREMRENR